MVGNLTFSQRFKLAQLRELNGVEHHRVMKQSACDHQLGDSPLRGVFKAVNPKTPRGKRRGWMQLAKFLTLARGGENISLDIPFYRIPLASEGATLSFWDASSNKDVFRIPVADGCHHCCS